MVILIQNYSNMCTVQLTSKFRETLVLFYTPQHISQITLMMFSSAQGTHRVFEHTYKYLHV